MTTLLELKEKLVRFYGKYEVYITPIVKFIVAFAALMTIDRNIGYMELVSSTPVALILGLLCAILPVGGTIFIAAVVILADMYALSIEVCLVALLLFVLIYFIYFRFAPRQGMGVLLTPICFRLNIPYVIPVGMGLLEEAYSVFAVICGTVVYFFLDGVRQNEKLLGGAAEESAEANSKIVVALNQLLGNKEMYLVLGIMAVTLIIVYLIRRMSIANAWQIAIASGILFETIGLIAGYMLLGISGKTVSVLVGNVISLLIAFVIQFLFFNLDYSRTERLQFEDDEYYYYVKAVPKAVVSGTNKQVKRFSGKDEKERLTKKRFGPRAEHVSYPRCFLAESVSLYESSKNLHNRYRGDHNHSVSDLLYAGVDQEYQSMDAAARFDGDSALRSVGSIVPDEHDHLDCKEYVKCPGDSSGCNLPAGDAQGA